MNVLFCVCVRVRAYVFNMCAMYMCECAAPVLVYAHVCCVNSTTFTVDSEDEPLERRLRWLKRHIQMSNLSAF